MEHEKSFVYTLILGTCMLISLMLVGKMLLYKPVPVHAPHMVRQEGGHQEQGMSTKYLSDTDLSAMLAELLPQDFPLEALSISVQKNGTVHAQGTIVKAKLLEASDMELLRALLKWLPDTFALNATFGTSISGNLLSLTLTDATAAGFQLPTDQMPEDWMNVLNTAVNQAIQSQGSASEIRLLDGGIQLLA